MLTCSTTNRFFCVLVFYILLKTGKEINRSQNMPTATIRQIYIPDLPTLHLKLKTIPTVMPSNLKAENFHANGLPISEILVYKIRKFPSLFFPQHAYKFQIYINKYTCSIVSSMLNARQRGLATYFYLRTISNSLTTP